MAGHRGTAPLKQTYVGEVDELRADAERYRFVRDQLRASTIADLAAMKRDWWDKYIDKRMGES